MHELPELDWRRIRDLTRGEQIRAARKAARLTQSELAGRAGTYAAAISNYERDLIRPRRETLRRIADALGMEDEERKET